MHGREVFILTEQNLLFKIMVLQLIHSAQEPLSKSQITDFFTDFRYADYFRIQSVIYELVDSRMLIEGPRSTVRLYTLSEEGERTREAFSDRISAAITRDIRTYLSDQGKRICQENSLTANYDKSVGGGYIVRLIAREEDREIIRLDLHVTGKDQAESLCYNWKVRYNEVYMQIVDLLLQ